MKERIKTPPWLSEALDEVRRIMGQMLECAQIHEGLRAAVESATDAGGKLLRPTLLLLCAGEDALLCGKREEILYSAAALEATHTASLIHDDVTDDAPTRRGRPSLQKSAGKCAAVYAGDYILVSVMHSLIRKHFIRTALALTDTIRRMCDGELIQLALKYDTGADEQRYFEAVEGKTAALFSTACRLGAELGGGTADQAATLAEYGRCLGFAFQLRDDLVDWMGDEAAAGKPVNADFFSGIYTLPAIATFRHAEYGPRLQELSAAAPGEAASEEARRLVSSSGGIAYTRAALSAYAERAEALANIESDRGVMLVLLARETAKS